MQLKTYLAENNITIADFARSIDQSEGAVKKWLRGERLPRLKAEKKIREATSGAVTIADFYTAEAA